MKSTIAIFLLAALTGCASQPAAMTVDPEGHTEIFERHTVELE